jgi:hypothetical protein
MGQKIIQRGVDEDVQPILFLKRPAGIRLLRKRGGICDVHATAIRQLGELLDGSTYQYIPC